MAELLGRLGPAVLAILCVVAAARVHRRRGEALTPAAGTADEAPVPDDPSMEIAPPEDWQCGDLARALRAARHRRRQRGGIVPKRDGAARRDRAPRRR
jgi:hypothetical protein